MSGCKDIGIKKFKIFGENSVVLFNTKIFGENSVLLFNTKIFGENSVLLFNTKIFGENSVVLFNTKIRDNMILKRPNSLPNNTVKFSVTKTQ